MKTRECERASEPDDPQRRDLLRATGIVTLGGVLGSSLGLTLASRTEAASAAGTTSLGSRLRGVQHFGITVQNMDRAYEFYTEVLGGTEIMRDGDFFGDRIQNTLLLTEEVQAIADGVNPRTLGIPDLRGGAQRLDVRFIQFDNVVIELLQYRDKEEPAGQGDSFAPARELTSPAFPRSMHVCFYIRDDVDFNQFVRDLEAESARRGMTQVKANRIVRATTEQQRLEAAIDSNTNRITEGPSSGWSLIYCKGPEGEQLEFVQVQGNAKQTFDGAYESRRKQLGG
ncbi:VOC family protein [Pseudomonas sp. JS3066]|jgi:catechol 2,3-dioxygenase-like lactoylglutathione lyase family enzyme|uniref:VOC family protein n=1 Tax=Pseudomonas sp. JS3066 TaxID=3090665 RepID=UPI002E7B7A11|nr:VOC family protein [Pseudomonas sp. JS3066]WVK95730.1 VOC family protein [Pseudomonas sp. JS3066]